MKVKGDMHMITPVLETERLIIRPMRLEESDEVYRSWTSDDRVSKYVRWSTHKSADETREWIKFDIESNKSDKTYNWGFELKQTGKLIGCGGIVEKDGAQKIYELGYNIMYDCWNHGYTTEAAKEMLRFGIEELGIREYVACHAVENPASGKVMEKCGFIYEKNEIHTKFDGRTSFEAKCYRLKV